MLFLRGFDAEPKYFLGNYSTWLIFDSHVINVNHHRIDFCLGMEQISPLDVDPGGSQNFRRK